MEASPLAKLSAEVRNMIYEHVLRVPIPIVLEADERFEKFPGKPVPTNVNPLTKTCRAIQLETTEIFYALNNFIISCNDTFRIRKEIQSYKLPTGIISVVLCTFDEATLFSTMIGPKNTAALRSVELRVGLVSLFDVPLWSASVLNLHLRKRHTHSGWWKVTFMRQASDSNPHAGAVCISLNVGNIFSHDCARWIERLEEYRKEDFPMHQADLRRQFVFWRDAALDEEKQSEESVVANEHGKPGAHS